MKLPSTYLFTQASASWKLVTEGCSGIIGVFFKTGTLQVLLKTPMTQILGHIIEPQVFWGDKAICCLMEQIQDAPPHIRIALVEKFLLKYCYRPPTSRVQYAIQLVIQHDGMLNVEQLSGKLGISRRAVEKQFFEKVGVSPKYYSRIVRFHALQWYLNNHPQSSWMDLTHYFGYFDQSHMIKDFKTFTGTSPLKYGLVDTFLSDHFLLQNRLANII